jgi:hypothetical protein
MRLAWAWFLTATLVGGCKDSTGFRAAGEPCNSSAECEPGLLCDLGLAEPVCSTDLTTPPDAAPMPDVPPIVIDAGIDAAPPPDAPPGTPDAGQPDAPPPPPPDAAPVDAPPPPPIDAAPPDAMV